MKENLKKILVLMLALAMIFTMAACTSNEPEPQPEPSGEGGETEVNYPDGTIEFICQYGAGGGIDICERTLAPHLQKYFDGNPVIVTNTTGGAGSIGLTAIYTSPADGQTMGITFPTEYVTAYMNQTDNTLDKFDLVCQLNFDADVVVIKTGGRLDGMTMPEIVEYSKENPLIWGINGTWTSADFVRFYMNEYGLNTSRVSYDGGAAALQALLNGDADMIGCYPSECLSYVEAGQMKVIAVASPERLQAYPDSPTFAEMGYETLTQNGIQRVFCVPAGTDPAIIAKLEEALLAVMDTKEFQDDYAAAGMTVIPADRASVQSTFIENVNGYLKYIEDNGYKPGDAPM